MPRSWREENEHRAMMTQLDAWEHRTYTGNMTGLDFDEANLAVTIYQQGREGRLVPVRQVMPRRVRLTWAARARLLDRRNGA
jgi:hypothetical protein